MGSSAGLVPGVRRIAVLRANMLGDFIFVLPALEALRAAYPEAEIVLLGRPAHAEYLAGRPSPVDRVLALPPGVPADDGDGLDEEGMRRVLGPIAAEGWDLALQMHGGGRYSNPVIQALGARVSAGCRAEDAPPLDRWIRYVYYQPEVTRYLEVASLVGAAPVTVEPRLAVIEGDRLALAEVAPELRDRPYVVLHPGASDPRRRWPPASFAAVGDALAAQGLAVAVTGTPGEETDVVRAVVEGMSAPAIDLLGRLAFDALVGLLADAELVVANDTGPLHLAAAVGAPTVGVYWCGNAINGGSLLRARHRLAISWRIVCPVCGLDCTAGERRCHHRASFVADVPAGVVLENALDLLSARPARAPA